MSDQHQEDLCAFLDGELDDAQARFLVRRLGHDNELADRWQRSHLVRAVLRGERRTHAHGLSERVSLVLDGQTLPAEPVVEPAHAQPAWLRPAVGMAVAASVAVVAFNAFQSPTPDTPPMEAPTVAAVSESAAVPPGMNVGGTRGTPASGSTARSAWANPRLQGYLLRHNEKSGTGGSRGLVPYVYLVSTPPADEADAGTTEADTTDVDSAVEGVTQQ